VPRRASGERACSERGESAGRNQNDSPCRRLLSGASALKDIRHIPYLRPRISIHIGSVAPDRLYEWRAVREAFPERSMEEDPSTGHCCRSSRRPNCRSPGAWRGRCSGPYPASSFSETLTLVFTKGPIFVSQPRSLRHWCWIAAMSTVTIMDKPESGVRRQRSNFGGLRPVIGTA
jgi:hypothetical protein